MKIEIQYANSSDTYKHYIFTHVFELCQACVVLDNVDVLYLKIGKVLYRPVMKNKTASMFF